MYTKKMHDAIRRDTKDKQHNQITDLLDEIEKLQKENEELRKIESADFWRNWVFPEGANPEQIKNELEDYHMILGEVSKVYDNITGGRISKPNTLASEVISVADEYYENICEEGKKDDEEFEIQTNPLKTETLNAEYTFKGEGHPKFNFDE